MRIEDEIKLTFDDVLIRPKRSTLSSRKDVDLKRTFRYEEKPSMAVLINCNTDWCHWVDITDKDL